jgi:hypothetical protein
MVKMVNWHLLHVPRLEWHIAADLGAERSNGDWWCTQTQFRSKDFKRWRSTATHRLVVIFPGDGRREREAAKQNRCLWCPTARHWYVWVTEQSSLRAWHRARLQPPTEYVIRVDYNEREAAKAGGCRWRPDIKRWVYACHGPPPGFVTRRRLDQPAATASAAAAAAA